jgi:hypothetical protein
LEAALAGLPAVLAFAPPLRLLATSDEAVDGILTTPPSEDAYVAEARHWMADADRRRQLGEQLRERVRNCHLGDGWRTRLGSVYQLARELRHQPSPIGTFYRETGDLDQALSAWQASNHREATAANRVEEVLKAAAYQARLRGDPRGAFALVRLTMKRHGWNRATGRAMLATLWQGLKTVGRSSPETMPQ